MTTLRTSGIETLRNRRVGVWGTGREGRALVRLALERGADVLVVQDPPAPEERAPDKRAPGERAPAELEVHEPGALYGARLDVMVVSPGVSKYRPELERLRSQGVVVTTATALWLEDFAGHAVIGITGSKGKTMTASLTALAMRSTGADVGIGGNMGTPVTDFYEGPERDAYVVEVSSFQAAYVTSSPRVGVLTLVAPDHLDWHGNYERYVSDKLNLFTHRGDLELAVNARSPEAVAFTSDEPFSSRVGGRHLYGADGAVRVGGNGIEVDGEEVPPLASLAAVAGSPLRGRHNLDNLCGAITATRLLTGDWPDFATLSESVSKMPSLPSRLATIAMEGGVEFVDDTLASNPAGTIAALEAFEGSHISLIAGGHDRGASLDALARVLASADGTTLVSLGGAGERLSDELGSMRSTVRCVKAGSMRDAVRLAATALGEDGGVVLLSPAAPTPASEGTYEARSAAFRSAVEHYLSDSGAAC